MDELIEKIETEIARCENAIAAKKGTIAFSAQVIAYLNVLKMIDGIVAPEEMNGGDVFVCGDRIIRFNYLSSQRNWVFILSQCNKGGLLISKQHEFCINERLAYPTQEEIDLLVRTELENGMIFTNGQMFYNQKIIKDEREC